MKRTWLEINKSAYFHNITQIRALTGAANLGVVVKGNAYGHGMDIIAQYAQEHDDISVILTVGMSEALQLRRNGIIKPLIVLGHYDADLEQVIANDIDFVCFDKVFLPEIDLAAQRAGKQARIHLKIDTGMTRLGIFPEHVDDFVVELAKYKHITVVGCMSHIADSESIDVSFTQEQLFKFDTVVERLKKQISTIEHVHACSSGSMVFAQGHTLIRVGLNQHGYWKSDLQRERCLAIKPEMVLYPTLTWKTHIIQIKQAQSDLFVGYNRMCNVSSGTKIALLPVGYCDGYSRLFSNKGLVQVNGVLVPVLGIVSMNLCAIDVTTVPDAAIGDEVTLLGDVPGITANDLARRTETINYVILTGIHPFLERRVAEKTVLQGKVSCTSSKVISEQENQHSSK